MHNYLTSMINISQ